MERHEQSIVRKRRQPARVLVVDADPMTRACLSFGLGADGYEVRRGSSNAGVKSQSSHLMGDTEIRQARDDGIRPATK